ncbi:MAG: LPS export ABC transporter periplasmic protein LptC [Ferruginibacter sp.]
MTSFHTTKGALFSVVMSVFATAILLMSCENDEERIKQLFAEKKIGIEEAHDVKIIYTIGGLTRSVLKAPLMLNVQEVQPYVEFPKTIHADFYNVEGRVESTLDAGYGKYRQYQSTIFLKDSVVVINIERGDTLYCEELYWDRNRTGFEFFTEKPVRVRTKTEYINGTGMESSQDFKNWHIKEVTGRISVPATSFPK